ncbi:hypothetical protein DES53_103223 [Roseimicrobium gellanilyticum]|uniref:Uncharacterized protein n=1 Tax=Roseimicrobium gellanilyticum TaxID=748857 RepID=A0A366HP03_9BACT|nr:hypothetical protein DES53_103223 [Roseimicrobium gellanilyticum]
MWRSRVRQERVLGEVVVCVRQGGRVSKCTYEIAKYRASGVMNFASTRLISSVPNIECRDCLFSMHELID